MKPRLIVAGFALLTVLALMGWTRKPTSEPASFDMPVVSAPAMTEPAVAPPQATAPDTVPAPAGHRDRLMARATDPVRQPVHRRVVVRERPIRHSVAIVGASAGTGAAIGALAGGGKGAGIGALLAGPGGFIY